MMGKCEKEEERGKVEASDSAKEDRCPYTLSSLASPCSHSALGQQMKVARPRASQLRVTREKREKRERASRADLWEEDEEEQLGCAA